MSGKAGGALALGIDYGTASGRVLVLDLADGSELAAVDVPYPHGVIEDTLPRHRRAARHRLGAAAPARLPRGDRARRPRGALRAPDVDPARVIGIGLDFTSCTVLPVDGRRHAAVPDRALALAPARLAEAVEAPRRAAAAPTA